MSIEYLNAAFKADIKNSSDKFVMVAMSDYANENGEAYPSVETLSNKTALDRKTIIKCLHSLSGLSLLSDTGERKGKTKKVVVYQIHLNRLRAIEIQKSCNSPKNGTVNDIVGNSPRFGTINSPKNGTVKAVKQSQIWDSEPSVILNHQREPSSTVQTRQNSITTGTQSAPPAKAGGECGGAALAKSLLSEEGKGSVNLERNPHYPQELASHVNEKLPKSRKNGANAQVVHAQGGRHENSTSEAKDALTAIIEDNFTRVWNAGLPRVKRKVAFEEYSKLCKGKTPDFIVKATTDLVEDIQNRITYIGGRDSPFLRTHLATYLLNKMWRDEDPPTIHGQRKSIPPA